MSKPILILLFAACASLSGGFAHADADASMHQIYEAASSGHLDQAQEMMAQVLKDHPASAKAHYVESELDAKQGKFGPARDEFQTAEKLAPGLPFAKPEAVSALRAELYPQARAMTANPNPVVTNAAPYSAAQAPARAHFPWGLVISIFLIVAIVWALLRRRQQAVMPGYGPGYGGAPGGNYGGGYGGGYPPPAGGGLLGSLGTGLAVGAGVVAGEELAHRLLDGGERRPFDGADSGTYREPQSDPNADMGGNDFGVSDSGSWDSSSDSAGGGGDDWS